MPSWLVVSGLYLVPALLLIMLYVMRQRQKTAKSNHHYQESAAAGMLEPASLHPVIDYSRCLGCATCIAACPEKQVLGIVDNRAKLIRPSSCIGHGACKTACPTQAIDLVFGTATRGVDIPHVGSDFQTNVTGIYVAGELGGMGLIRNAIEQGRQAIDAIATNSRCGQNGQIDVVIIGAGPAGISAAMAAAEKGLSYRVFEQDTVGGTIAHYPRGKIVMTAPAKLPIVGEFHFGETSKENLMEFWTDAIERAGIEIQTNTRVESVTATPSGFEVQCKNAVTASNVLLAIGRRGTPRKLGVPGEDHNKVVYRLIDPQQYQGQKVIVVGGGDSALEAALSLSEEAADEVVLSYRGEAFNRVKPKNRERTADAEQAGTLRVEMNSQLLHINKDSVQLKTSQGETTLANDAVIVCAGGILPTGFLKDTGIEIQTHFGTVR